MIITKKRTKVKRTKWILQCKKSVEKKRCEKKMAAKQKHNETEQTEMRLRIKTEQIYIIRVYKRMSLKCLVCRWKMEDERQTQAQKHKHSVDNQLDLNEWQNERDMDMRTSGARMRMREKQNRIMCIQIFRVWTIRCDQRTNETAMQKRRKIRKSKYVTVKRNQTNETNVN